MKKSLKIIIFCLVFSLNGKKILLNFKNFFRKNDEKITYSIIGFPCSGTTIIGSFFNSFENSFCLSEPILSFFSQGFIKLEQNTNKVFDLNLTQPENFINDIKIYLKKQNIYKMGGIKETFSEYGVGKLLLDGNANFKIFIFRDPYVLLNSCKKACKESLFANINSYIKYYKEYVNFYLDYKNTCCFIYENFALNPYSYTNKKLENYFEITGKGDLEIWKNPVACGNLEAKQSTEVRPARMDISLLTDEERERIKKELWPLYEKFLLLDSTKGINYRSMRKG